MSEQFSEIGLTITRLETTVGRIVETLTDLHAANRSIIAGQSGIMDQLRMVNRQLAEMVAAMAKEPGGDLDEIMRAILAELNTLVPGLKALPHAVAAKVLLETDGLVLPAEC